MELDHLKNPTSELLQPIGLYCVANNTTFHLNLSNMVADALITTLMDKETFRGANLGIFEDPNPETRTPPPSGKPKLLKFKLIYSKAHLPEGGLMDVMTHLATPPAGQEYKKQFEFDEKHRIRSAGAAESNQINSGPAGNQSSASSSSAVTLEQCLKYLSKVEHLTGSN